MTATQVKRTFMAAVIGVLIARIIAALPTLAQVIAWLDGVFAEAGFAGVSTLEIIKVILTGAVVLLYQWLVQRLGDRWPKIEAFLLGSSARPEYIARHSPINKELG